MLAVTIAVLSLWPLATLPKVPGSDKTHHFIAYASLMIPVALFKRERIIFYYLGFLAFSGAIELLQPYVNRYCDWKDLLANGLGLLCGWVIAISFKRISCLVYR
jgi:VanZ family protein